MFVTKEPVTCYMTREPLCLCEEVCASWLLSGWVFTCLFLTYTAIFLGIYFSPYNKPREKKSSEELPMKYNHYTKSLSKTEEV